MIAEARLSVFHNLFRSIADEMGVTIQRTAASPNIKERLDYSCALFSPQGELVAQAAHIPVHLGSMTLAVEAVLQHVSHFSSGDIVMLNDPFRGGTHLPDITLIQPIFSDDNLLAFAATRAHHNDIGGSAPGSMSLANTIFQEGLRIPPVKLYEAGNMNEDVFNLFLANVRVPRERRIDLQAQAAAVRRAERRFLELVRRYDAKTLQQQMEALLAYTERLMRKAIEHIPDGTYSFTDVLDDDGFDSYDLPIALTLRIHGDEATLDFSQSAPQAKGPINCVYAVTLAAVMYAFRCLLDGDAPTNGGTVRCLHIDAPEGTVVNAAFPAPVAAGNVETSQRIVDVVLGALGQALPHRIPAAACGSMNNISIGGYKQDGTPFAYYETIGGGMGASKGHHGHSAVQVHMTNTKNTPVEALELAYPFRIHQYRVRQNSGGNGQYRGGDGIVRELEVLTECHVSLLTERRRNAPYGTQGGQPGQRGNNFVFRKNAWQHVSPKVQLQLAPGERIKICTPGGGGFGRITS